MDISHNMTQKSRALSAREGFTLIEILIAMGIGFAIIAGVFSMINLANKKFKRNRADTELISLSSGIMQFQLDTGKPPATLKDLVKRPSDAAIANKWKGDYIPQKEVPTDPWGQKYQYKPGTEDQKYELYSYGPEGKKASKSEWIRQSEE